MQDELISREMKERPTKSIQIRSLSMPLLQASLIATMSMDVDTERGRELCVTEQGASSYSSLLLDLIQRPILYLDG